MVNPRHSSIRGRASFSTLIEGMPFFHKEGITPLWFLHQDNQSPGEGRISCLRASHKNVSWLRGYVCSYGGVVDILDIHIAIATQLSYLV